MSAGCEGECKSLFSHQIRCHALHCLHIHVSASSAQHSGSHIIHFDKSDQSSHSLILAFVLFQLLCGSCCLSIDPSYFSFVKCAARPIDRLYPYCGSTLSMGPTDPLPLTCSHRLTQCRHQRAAKLYQEVKDEVSMTHPSFLYESANF